MQTDYILIFVLLTLGYFSLRIWNYLYFRSVKYSEQELFFASGVAGTIILIIGEVLHSFGHKTLLFSLHFFLNDSLNLSWEKFHSLSIGFGVTTLLSLVYNRFVNKGSTVQGVIDENNDGLELMLLDSLNFARVLSFTLTNNKVYIGLVVSEPFSPKINESFQILPLLSGYRKRDGTLALNTDYISVYDTLKKENKTEQVNQFSISLSVKDIITCSYFDIDIYDKFGSQKNNDELAQNGILPMIAMNASTKATPCFLTGVGLLIE